MDIVSCELSPSDCFDFTTLEYDNFNFADAKSVLQRLHLF